MDEVTQDVGGDSPSATIVEESTLAAPSSESISGEAASTQPAGDVTAGTDALGSTDEQEGATPPPSEDDESLEGVPSLDELQQQAGQKVPYAEALFKLRTAYEARKGELGELQARQETANFEKYGGLETAESRLETFNALFTPVVDPTTNQPEIDPSTGFPVITTSPFIERVDAENPGMAEQILNDVLRYQVDYGNGPVALWQAPQVQENLMKAWGLDSSRINDYRNIDALSQPTGVITPEELEAIPEGQREAYKTLPQSLRESWNVIPDDEKQWHIDVAQERLTARENRETQAREQQESRQQAEVQAREYVQGEQEKYVSQQLQEGYATIMDDLASKVTFGDENTNAAAFTSIGALLFSARDPDFRAANSARFEQLGIKLGSDFDEALNAADTHLRQTKTYELFKQEGMRQNALTQARAAKNVVLAKLAPIALRAAKAMGAVAANKAATNGKLLDSAGNVRPTPGQSGSVAEQGGGYLPPGMRANDPQAGVYLARKTGLLG